MGAVRSRTVVKSAPAPSSISGPSVVCGLTSATYTAAAVTGATSYIWTLPGGFTGNSVTNSISVSINQAQFTGGSISVAAINACGTGSSRSLTLSLKSNAPGLIAGPREAVCAGSTQTFSCSAANGAASYEWIVPSGAQITAGQGTSNITVRFPTPYLSGIVSVAAVNSCGKSSPRSITVRSVPAAIVSVSGPNSNLCGGGTFTYSVSPAGGASSYEWTVPAGCTVSGSSSGNSIQLIVPANFSSGQLSVRARNNCGFTNTATLNLTSQPATSGIILGPGNVCANQQGINFSTLPVNGVTSFQWSVPTGAQIISGQGTPSIVVDWGNSLGSVSVFSKNNCGNGLIRSRNINITCREASEISEDENSEVLIFPNPARDRFNIRIPAKEFNQGASYRLFNFSGQLIAYERIMHAEFVIDRNVLPLAGLYLIEFTGLNDRKSIVRKISIVD